MLLLADSSRPRFLHLDRGERQSHDSGLHFTRACTGSKFGRLLPDGYGEPCSGDGRRDLRSTRYVIVSHDSMSISFIEHSMVTRLCTRGAVEATSLLAEWHEAIGESPHI